MNQKSSLREVPQSVSGVMTGNTWHLPGAHAAVYDGIFISDPATGRFIEVNQPACNMFGYTKGELIGQDVDTLSSGVHPHTRDMEKATQPTDAFDFADLVVHALFEMLV
jgi:PAS domain-containing protein